MIEVERTIAYTCPYVPAEWIAAHGLRPQRVIPQAVEGPAIIPRLAGLCPYARAFANEVAARDDIGGIVVTTLCDQMRRVFELLVRRVDVPVFLLNVPSTWQTVAAQRLYLDELQRLGRFLVRLGGHTPDRERLIRAMLEPVECALHTDVLQASCPRSEGGTPSTLAARPHLPAHDEDGVHSTPYRADHPDGANGAEKGGPQVRGSFHPVVASSVAGSAGHPTQLKRATQPPDDNTVASLIRSAPSARAGVPLAVVGGPLMRRDRILFEIVEDCGGRIVLDATETGQRGARGPFDRRRLAEDPLMELAQTYFQIPDASRRPNSELYRWLKGALARAGTRGILFHHYVWCDKWRAEFGRLQEWTSLPVLRLDSEGDGRISEARLRTRIRAFLEMFS